MARSRKRFDRLPAGPLDDLPAPPADLDQTGQEVWNTCGTYLCDRGLLATGDLHALECYCRAVSRVRRVERELIDAPLLMDNGKPNPLLAAASSAQGVARNWCSTLHLSPYSRIALSKATKSSKTPPKAQQSPWADVISLPERRGA
jgi:P27 family predicted phage terminase small subunit